MTIRSQPPQAGRARRRGSPLVPRLTSNAGIPPARLYFRQRVKSARLSVAINSVPSASRSAAAATTISTSPTSPCNMFANNNFVVRIHKFFRLHKMVTDSTDNGIARTEFDPFRRLPQMALTSSAQKIRDVPNAGGNSIASEVLSFEMLAKCFGARLVKTEMEVEYFPEGGSITDYVCEMFGHTLGVSVTRAMKYSGDFTTDDAHRLLNKKLKGVVQSSKNSLERWSKQILHVWATSVSAANVITRAYENVSADVRANTVVLVTVATSAVDVFANK